MGSGCSGSTSLSAGSGRPRFIFHIIILWRLHAGFKRHGCGFRRNHLVFEAICLRGFRINQSFQWKDETIGWQFQPFCSLNCKCTPVDMVISGFQLGNLSTHPSSHDPIGCDTQGINLHLQLGKAYLLCCRPFWGYPRTTLWHQKVCALQGTLHQT